ncbi:response regulator [Pseudomonas sp. F1_0610]|uniref:response regulator n=1 Tax=Pseudomonas sp. F1_0610 TaxID=3114284 RepID=UPI0039C4C46F
MKLLVVEDEALLRHHLFTRLGEQGHIADAVANAEEALYRIEEFNHDLAIIDLGLPGMGGLELIKQLREAGKTFPILILTARGNWQDKVEGLAAGADDYVVKPFQFEELEARLNALLRRSSGFTQANIEAGPLTLDLNRKQALLEGEPLGLTAYEYRILEYLMRHHQQVVAKERLMEQLYSDEADRDPNVIEVLVGRLRRKIEGKQDFKPIETVRGQGYIFTQVCH